MRSHTLRAFVIAVMLTGSALLPGFARAQAQAQVLSTDTQLVVFRFDPNVTYPVLSRPGVVTHIQLNSGETLKALAVGDTVQWQVQQTGSNIFIKPVKSDLFTSATIVTDKRTYQLTLRSSPTNGRWFQRVSWEYPDLILFDARHEQQAAEAEAVERTRIADQTITSTGSPIERLNFNYEIKGKASFRPAQVFDDGKFTWVHLAKNQELPAFFILNEKGEAELANYLVKGEFLEVQRLFREGVFKLGEAEVRIVNTTWPEQATRTSRMSPAAPTHSR